MHRCTQHYFSLSHSLLLVVGVDFVLTSVSLTLNPNVTRSCVNIDIVDDLIIEGTEQFELNLQSFGAGVVSIVRQSIVIVIQDNDCKFLNSVHIIIPVSYFIDEVIIFPLCGSNCYNNIKT